MRALCMAAAFLLTASFLAHTAHAATYYVRTDGGTAFQCNGSADAPYPGSGSAQDCAWMDPTIPLPLGDDEYGHSIPPPLIHGGDTLVIGPGAYMVGWGAPGDSAPGTSCSAGGGYLCEISNIPSGTDAAHPTIITGQSCSSPPQLWGTQRVYEILKNVHDIQIKCLELTDHSNCIEFYGPDSSYACKRDAYPYGTWGEAGIYANNVQNLYLYDLNIHGFASTGIQAGGLSGTTTLDGVRIVANGHAGFNGDLGSGSPSSDSGTILIQNSTISWNGCAEDYPGTTIILCWGQNEGGYGDGLGTATTGGNWKFINDTFQYNTQDGLDLRYADGTGSIYVDRSLLGMNNGNDIKTSGSATVQNSVINNYCTYYKDQTSFPAGQDYCRAEGAEWVGMNASGQTVTWAYNTVTGNGDCLIYGSGVDSTDNFEISNNIFLGNPSGAPGDAGKQTCFASMGTNITATYTNNNIWNVRQNGKQCPAGSICSDPFLKNETLQAFDPTLTTSSPASNAAVGCPAYDWSGYGRCSIGAIDGIVARERQAAPAQ